MQVGHPAIRSEDQVEELRHAWAELPEEERIRVVHDLLAQFIQGAAELDVANPAHLKPPPADRPILTELHHGRALTGPEPWNPNPVAFATMLADSFLLTAEDHLRGLRAVLHDGTAMQAALSMSRVVVEAAARAWWLLDPGIDARTRVARAMTERLAELAQRIRSGRQLRLPSTNAAYSEQEAILFGARANRFPVTTKGAVPAIGERSPTSSDLVRRMNCSPDLPGGQIGRLMYADLSSAIHGYLEGRVWQREWQVIGRSYPPDDGFVRALTWAACCAAAGYSEARGRHTVLYGLDEGRWERGTRGPLNALYTVLLLPACVQEATPPLR
jgi:hypothetical protein